MPTAWAVCTGWRCHSGCVGDGCHSTMQGAAREELEAWLHSVPWADMPQQCRPDAQFKDADSDRQRLRTARKLAQVSVPGVRR